MANICDGHVSFYGDAESVKDLRAKLVDIEQSKHEITTGDLIEALKLGKGYDQRTVFTDVSSVKTKNEISYVEMSFTAAWAIDEFLLEDIVLMAYPKLRYAYISQETDNGYFLTNDYKHVIYPEVIHGHHYEYTDFFNPKDEYRVMLIAYLKTEKQMSVLNLHHNPNLYFPVYSDVIFNGKPGDLLYRSMLKSKTPKELEGKIRTLFDSTSEGEVSNYIADIETFCDLHVKGKKQHEINGDDQLREAYEISQDIHNFFADIKAAKTMDNVIAVVIYKIYENESVVGDNLVESDEKLLEIAQVIVDSDGQKQCDAMDEFSAYVNESYPFMDKDGKQHIPEKYKYFPTGFSGGKLGYAWTNDREHLEDLAKLLTPHSSGMIFNRGKGYETVNIFIADDRIKKETFVMLDSPRNYPNDNEDDPKDEAPIIHEKNAKPLITVDTKSLPSKKTSDKSALKPKEESEEQKAKLFDDSAIKDGYAYYTKSNIRIPVDSQFTLNLLPGMYYRNLPKKDDSSLFIKLVATSEIQKEGLFLINPEEEESLDSDFQIAIGILGCVSDPAVYPKPFKERLRTWAEQRFHFTIEIGGSTITLDGQLDEGKYKIFRDDGVLKAGYISMPFMKGISFLLAVHVKMTGVLYMAVLNCDPEEENTYADYLNGIFKDIDLVPEASDKSPYLETLKSSYKREDATDQRVANDSVKELNKDAATSVHYTPIPDKIYDLAKSVMNVLSNDPKTSSEIASAIGQSDLSALKIANAVKYMSGVEKTKVVRRTVNSKGLAADKEFTAYYAEGPVSIMKYPEGSVSTSDNKVLASAKPHANVQKKEQYQSLREELLKVLSNEPMTSAEIWQALGREISPLLIDSALKDCKDVKKTTVRRQIINRSGLKSEQEYSAWFLCGKGTNSKPANGGASLGPATSKKVASDSQRNKNQPSEKVKALMPRVEALLSGVPMTVSEIMTALGDGTVQPNQIVSAAKHLPDVKTTEVKVETTDRNGLRIEKTFTGYYIGTLQNRNKQDLDNKSLHNTASKSTIKDEGIAETIEIDSEQNDLNDSSSLDEKPKKHRKLKAIFCILLVILLIIPGILILMPSTQVSVVSPSVVNEAKLIDTVSAGSIESHKERGSYFSYVAAYQSGRNMYLKASVHLSDPGFVVLCSEWGELIAQADVHTSGDTEIVFKIPKSIWEKGESYGGDKALVFYDENEYCILTGKFSF